MLRQVFPLGGAVCEIIDNFQQVKKNKMVGDVYRIFQFVEFSTEENGDNSMEMTFENGING